MNIDNMIHLTDGFETKADKMRVLERAGYARADIARFLGVRYQQVRNTLEGDKRTGYAPELYPAINVANELPNVYSMFRNIGVGDDGFANVPPDLIEGIVDDGEELFAIRTKDGIFLSSLQAMADRVRSSLTR
jgi:hypothetical protein